MGNKNSYGLAGAFLRAANSGNFVMGASAAQPEVDHAAVVCQLYCSECGIVTPHEYMQNGWSCVCCGHYEHLKTMDGHSQRN